MGYAARVCSAIGWVECLEKPVSAPLEDFETGKPEAAFRIVDNSLAPN